MKYKVILFAAFLAIVSNIQAQDLKYNSFDNKKVTSFFNTKEVKERINPTFPVQTKDSSNQSSQNSNYIRPDSRTRLKRYLDSAYGLSALMNAGASAAFGFVTNSPKEWHRTTEGFGKRFASSYGQRIISQTVVYGLNETFKLDNHFEKSNQKGFNKRFKHVLVRSFATRTEKGKFIPDFPQFIGSYTGNIIAKETWYPKRYTYKDGITGGTLAIFTRLGVHFVQEFFF